MWFSVRKCLVVVFVALTLALSVGFSYSLYAYFGVYKAVRDIHFSIQGFNFTFVGGNASIQVNLTMHNPSSFSFGALFLRQTLYLDGRRVGEEMLIWTGQNVRKTLPIPPFSNTHLTITTTNSTSLPPEPAWDWRIKIFMQLETFFRVRERWDSHVRAGPRDVSVSAIIAYNSTFVSPCSITS